MNKKPNVGVYRSPSSPDPGDIESLAGSGFEGEEPEQEFLAVEAEED